MIFTPSIGETSGKYWQAHAEYRTNLIGRKNSFLVNYSYTKEDTGNFLTHIMFSKWQMVRTAWNRIGIISLQLSHGLEYQYDKGLPLWTHNKEKLQTNAQIKMLPSLPAPSNTNQSISCQVCKQQNILFEMNRWKY